MTSSNVFSDVQMLKQLILETRRKNPEYNSQTIYAACSVFTKLEEIQRNSTA